MRTVAWYLRSRLNSGSFSVSGPSPYSLDAGWEDFLKPQSWVGSNLFHPSWDGLRPPMAWGASSPSSNGALPTHWQHLRCGLWGFNSVLGKMTPQHSGTQGLLAYFTCQCLFVSGGVSIPIAACTHKPGRGTKKASTHPKLWDFLRHNTLT